jgi:hypothetical protein
VPYKIKYGPGAFDRLPARLPAEVLESLDDAFRRLAESPTQCSRPAVFPYPPRGQVFHHHCDHQGIRHWFVVFFHYGQDETTLDVFAITHDCQPWQLPPDQPE